MAVVRTVVGTRCAPVKCVQMRAVRAAYKRVSITVAIPVSHHSVSVTTAHSCHLVSHIC